MVDTISGEKGEPGELDNAENSPAKLPDRRPDINDDSAGETQQAASETSHASTLGWRPKDEFKGNPNDWMTEELFVATQPLREKINGMGQAISRRDEAYQNIEKKNNDLMRHMAEQSVKDLKKSRKLAMEDEDYDRAEEFSDQITEIKAQQRVAETQPVAPPPVANARLDKFKRDNEWYENDVEMTAFAVSMSQNLVNKRGSWDDSIVDKTEEAVKRAYPEKFTNQRRQSAQPVESNRNASLGRKNRYSASDLDDASYKVMQGLVRSGTLTEKQYVEQMEAVGYFKE